MASVRSFDAAPTVEISRGGARQQLFAG